MRKKVCTKISEALKVLPNKKSPLYKELKNHPNKNDWLVEGDYLTEDGKPNLFIIEDTKENAKMLLQHQQIDLSDI